jgi:glycosyltransferase involved in cell wall biosynthesis
MFRVAVLVVAYNAEKKLADVLQRIPELSDEINLEVLVCDDASLDKTSEVGHQFVREFKRNDINIVRHEINLGYGGNQKFGYEWALANNFDAVVLLHGDGQYAPELIESIIRPILSHKADVVLGSRMMTKGSALAGGMPFYKFVGNKILTRWQNFITGTELSEWHCGYRAYSVQSLKSINYLENSDGFDFDTQIILQMNSAGKQIIEVPIPTYYGDEICYVQGLKYARQVSIEVVKHRLKSMGFFASRVTSPEYRFKHDEHSSHGKIKKVIENLQLGSVLDVGCAGGEISEYAAQIGHKVVAIDLNQPQNQLTNAIFVQHDLDKGLPLTIEGKFDLIICADVLEHLRTPDKLLYDLQERLTTSGKIIASIPNFGNWYPRIRVLLGKFDYDARGILDQSHLRFFTRKSFTRIANTAGYDVTKIWTTGTPFEVMLRGAPKRRISWKTMLSVLAKIDRGLCCLRATLFSYQFIFELTPKTSRRRTETKN